MRQRRRGISLLLLASLLSGLLPGGSVQAAGNGKAIQKGTGVLQESVNTTSAATVYYGLDNRGQSYAYSVIGYGSGGVQTTDSTEKTATLLAKSGYTTTQFSPEKKTNYYADSRLKTIIDGIAGKLTAGEENAVVKRDLKVEPYSPSSPYTDGINSSTVATGEVAVTGAALWPLSTKEANNVNANVRVLNPSNSGTDFWWWLRSPGLSDRNAAFVHGYGSVYGDGYDVAYESFAVRPAFHLNLDSVLFTSAAESGKSSAVGGDKISDIDSYAGTEWKLTVKDKQNRQNFKIGTTAAEGNTLTVAYTGAQTGRDEYLSAMIADNSGAYTHYGKLKKLENPEDASSTVKIDLSKVGDMTGKTLYVFNEQDKGKKKTDCASEMKEVSETKNAYTITNSLTHVTTSNEANFRLSSDSEDYTATFTPDNDYILPTEVTVKVDEVPLAPGDDYEYEDGSLTIDNEKITGDITITANAVAKSYGLSIEGADTHATGNFGTAHAGYTSLPAAQTFQIENTGNQPVNNITVRLTAGEDFFTLNTTGGGDFP